MIPLMHDYHAAMKMLKEAQDMSEDAASNARKAQYGIGDALRYLNEDRRRINKALLLSLIDKPVIEPSPLPAEDEYVTTQLKERAVFTAVGEWTRPVKEPKGEGWERIDDYIRGELGLGWLSADASDLGNLVPYTKNGQFAWCGAFQAWCWGNAGLKSDIRRKHIASLYRIHSWAEGTKRIIAPEDIKRGDIVCMGPIDGPKYGQHMALAFNDYLKGAVVCLEGNATGTGKNGEVYEGVTQNKRPVAGINGQIGDNDSTYHVLYGVRFLMGDIDHA